MPQETIQDVERRRDVIQILSDLVETLDVPPSKYEEAKGHYEDVGAWLDADDSPLKRYRPAIYPQGSFALGTVVRPVGEDDYDVDTVCRLSAPPPDITQQRLKAMVGHRLKQHGKYAKMIDPADGGRRCWTLRYEEGSQFHLDILPAMPDDPSIFIRKGIPNAIAQLAILITDNMTWDYEVDWPKSNPAGYVLWFKEQMRFALNESKKAYAQRVQASVTSIQDYQVRTPLQQAIQLLKRHRDICCMGDDDRPISIIITTLAAQVYQNETTLVAALTAIVPQMREALYRQKRADEWWVANPVNPDENFADKWKETPHKAEVFLGWLDAVEAEFKALLSESDFARVSEYLTEAFGAREASETMTRYAKRKQQNGLMRLGIASSTSIALPESVRELSSFEVTHRLPLKWFTSPIGTVKIEARWRKSGNWRSLASTKSQVITGSEIEFRASTTVQPPYEVFWQVVNTGKAARASGDLRGDYFRSLDPANPLAHHEGTSYRGRHWIECFIVRNGVCVARSGEFIINIV